MALVTVTRPATRAGARARKAGRFDAVIVPLTLLVLWEVASRAGIVQAYLLPPPSAVVAYLAGALRSGELAAHVGVSVVRVLAGFSAGVALALPVAVAVGLSPRAERLLDPTLQAIRSIPSLAWVPLLLLWMGIDEAPKVTLIAIGAFFPFYLNLVAGIHGIDRKLVEVGRVHGLTQLQIIRHIVLPGALPSALTGLRAGMNMAWLFLVAAELIAGTRGLGFLLTDGRELSRADIVLGAILLLALAGKFFDGVLKLLEDRLLRWRDGLKEAKAGV